MKRVLNKLSVFLLLACLLPLSAQEIAVGATTIRIQDSWQEDSPTLAGSRLFRDAQHPLRTLVINIAPNQTATEVLEELHQRLKERDGVTLRPAVQLRKGWRMQRLPPPTAPGWPSQVLFVRDETEPQKTRQPTASA